ncbi:MAG TPA: hypothetical protein VMR25_14055, partial [Planctomycetaceae bacterium]|nr:hypothetical protein [Planctomycetaceae bacterium]
GMLEELRQIITPKCLTEDESRKLLHTVEEFLTHEQARAEAHVGPAYARYLDEIREWSQQFRPNDFAGRLRDVCARSPWDRRFDRDTTNAKDETADLAASILQQPALLAAELDWLAGSEAQSAEMLGFALGRIDTLGDCGRMIFEHAIAHKAAPLLRGYIRGMVHADRLPTEDLLSLMAKLESVYPELAIDVLSYAGDNFDALNRILGLVDAKRVSARYLANLARGLGRRELTPVEVDRLIPYFTRAAATGDADTVLAGVRFLSTYLLFESRHSAVTCLTSDATRCLAWQLVESVLPYLASHSGSEWARILKKLAAFDADRASRLLAQALLAEDVAFQHEAARELSELAEASPKSAMAGFGWALLDSERGWILQVAVYRDLVGTLPSEIVLAWVREHGIEAARAIARHMPLPHLDEAGNPVVPNVLDSLFREYDDDKVFVNFLGGSRSGEAWWGNGGAQFRRSAEYAKKFLDHPNCRIREWAKNEINYRLKLAELEDQEHEERLLPS